MEDASDITTLPTLPTHALHQLCNTTVALARQVDAMLAMLERERGFAVFEFDIKRGELGLLKVTRSFRMTQS